MASSGGLDRTIGKVLAYTIVLLAVQALLSILLYGLRFSFLYGLGAGGAMAILMFFDLKNTLVRASSMPPLKAKRFAAMKYFARFILTGVVLALMIRSPYVDILGGVLGLLTLKFAVYLTHLFDDKGYYQRIFKRRDADGK